MNVSKMFRTLAEKLTRRWVFSRSLPTVFGSAPIFVTPSAGLKFLFKPMSQTDPNLFRNVMEVVREGDVVWDIGANIGLFAFSAAARAGRQGKIVAFEPDAWLVQLLRRSAKIQPLSCAPTTIVPAAVAADVSLRKFVIASRSRASNAIAEYGHSQMGIMHEEQTVVAFSLDWLATRLPRPNVIKCDVEGAEIEVFLGQSQILGEIRPVIICEIGSETAAEMTSVFLRQNYRLFDGEKPLAGNAEVKRAVWNTIAIPQEMCGAFGIPCRHP